jgi:hypothetical protein
MARNKSKVLLLLAIFGASFFVADAWAARDCLREPQFQTVCQAICTQTSDWGCVEDPDFGGCCITGLDEFGEPNGTCGEKSASDCPECNTGGCGM